MNIFILDIDPSKNAQYHGNKHVIKMIVETAQLLCTAHRLLDGTKRLRTGSNRIYYDYVLNDSREFTLYKATHHNHPSAIWVRTSSENYSWTLALLKALLIEYTYRYGKHHSTQRLLDELNKFPLSIPIGPRTEFALVMPDLYKIVGNPVESYRNFYRNEKRSSWTWKNREVPKWISDLVNGEEHENK